MCNAPKNPKAWYQFGQRIVGWSRIAQILVMQLCYPYCKGIANGDTDSVKFVLDAADSDAVIAKIDNALRRYDAAIDKAKKNVCGRVARMYPEQFDRLDGIGHYVREFEAENFCCAWNKAYTIYDGKHYRFTLAGVPTSSSKREIDYNGCADWMSSHGESFADICHDLLGYNLTVSNDVTGLHVRLLPEWGSMFAGKVTDWCGHTANVAEPAALALFPMSKTLNDTNTADNASNMAIALQNEPGTVCEPRTLYYMNGKPEIIRTKEMHHARLQSA